jgi:adenylate cyclase
MAQGIGRWFTRRLLTGIAAVLIGLVIPLTPPGRTLEKTALDLFFILRGARPTPEGVAIVAIDEASFGEIGKRWPWPRSLYGTLTTRLAEQGARVIGFDILFVEPDRPEEDEAFASAIDAAGNVVLAGDVVEESGPWGERLVAVEPHPLLKRRARGVGFVSLGVDEDHFIRATPLTFGGRPGLSLEIARVSGWTGKAGSLSGEGPLHIDFTGPAGAVRTVSFYQALDPETHLPPRFFRDRVVLVGLALGATPDPGKRRPDVYPVPFSRWGGALMSGVEIHANVLLNLLDRKELLPVKGAVWVLLTVMLGTGVSIGLSRFRLFPGFAAGAIAGGVWLIGAFGLFLWKGWCLPLISPLVQIATAYGGSQALSYIAKEREARWLRQAFASYLSPEVAAEVLDHPDKLRLGGERIEGTVLFADLAGFTALSEALPPEVLIGLLNDYLGGMTEVILRHDGTLDKYMGDAVMAFWGAPMAREDHALRACRSAVSMQERMASLREAWQEKGVPGLHCRIGISSGVMTAGNVGSGTLFDYTVIGDTVNLAARLEKLNKRFGTPILISESTWLRVRHEMATREAGTVQIDQRTSAVRVFELATGGKPGTGQGEGPLFS